MSSAASGSSTLSASPTASTTSHPSPSSPRAKRKRRRPPAIPVLLHDAPISDHLDVGVQTWGSAILLGRELAVRPEKFGLLPRTPAEEEMFNKRGTRVLELGAGTGLLGILCRKLLDLHSSTREDQVREHLVLATDFLPSVLDNLKLCVDLNFPSAPSATSSSTTSGGVDIAKLDWVTFPAFAERYHAGKSPSSKPAALPRDSINSDSRSNDLAKADTNQLRYPLERTIARPDAPEEVEDDAANPMLPYMDAPFDLVLVSDCVYDPTHAEMIRNVAGWALRPPNPDIEGDIGGTMVRPLLAAGAGPHPIAIPSLSRRVQRANCLVDRLILALLCYTLHEPRTDITAHSLPTQTDICPRTRKYRYLLPCPLFILPLGNSQTLVVPISKIRKQRESRAR